MKGYLEQDGTPTPDNPAKIKTQVIGNNLFETYEVNGRTYTDNLPKNALISIPKEQYIEYEQQKEETKRLNKQIEEYQKALDETTSEKIDLENIIKEVREYIEKNKEPLHHYFDEPDCDYWIATNPNDILEILDKEKE